MLALMTEQHNRCALTNTDVCISTCEATAVCATLSCISTKHVQTNAHTCCLPDCPMTPIWPQSSVFACVRSIGHFLAQPAEQWLQPLQGQGCGGIDKYTVKAQGCLVSLKVSMHHSFALVHG